MRARVEDVVDRADPPSLKKEGVLEVLIQGCREMCEGDGGSPVFQRGVRTVRLVPAGVLCQLVVGDDVGPNLILGQLIEPDRRRLAIPAQLCRSDTPMPGNQAAFWSQSALDS